MAKKTPKVKASFSRAGIGIGVLVQTACVLFLVIAANYVGFNYFQRWDFSRSQRFTLADQTKQVLRQFDGPMKVVVYYSPTSLGPETALDGDMRNLLAELQFSARNKLQVEWVDPARNLARALEVQAKYKFDGRESVLLFDYAGRTKSIPTMDLGEFDVSGLESGQPIRLQAFKGEAVLTSAFIELLNPQKAKIYFLQGHGEPSSVDLQQLQAAVDRQNAECWALNLGSQAGVPKDADVVCIFGARYDLSENEIAILRHYWQQNGRLIVLVDPDALLGMPNFRKFLNGAFIYPENKRVLRLLQNPLNPALIGILRDVVGVFLPDSPYTKRLDGVNAYFVGGTLPLQLDRASAARADVKVSPLIQATQDYWGELHYADAAKEGVRYDEAEDTGQPVILAAAAEKGGAHDDRTDVATSRMVVVGSSKFIEDRALTDSASQGNLDFVISAINRMLDGRSKLTGVTARTTVNFMLNLNDAQLHAIALDTLIFLPGAAALLGIVMALRRRA